jgi:non-ribosomal peptide synthetase component F
LAHQEGVTLFMGLLAAFVTFLHGCTRQEDLVVGTLSPSGRKQSRFQKVMGHFLNPVALRFDLTANPTFRQLLRQAQRLTLEAISNDDVPIGSLQQELRSKLQRNGNSLFRVAISLQPPMPAVGLDWSVTSMDVESGGSPWDLYLAFIDRPEGMSARVQYNSDVFAAETIARMWEQFETLLGSVSRNPESGISEFEFCPEQAAAAPSREHKRNS